MCLAHVSIGPGPPAMWLDIMFRALVLNGENILAMTTPLVLRARVIARHVL